MPDKFFLGGRDKRNAFPVLIKYSLQGVYNKKRLYVIYAYKGANHLQQAMPQLTNKVNNPK